MGYDIHLRQSANDSVNSGPGETPLTSAAMIALGERAGIPPGVINNVTALKHTVEVGALLTSSKVVKKVRVDGW